MVSLRRVVLVLAAACACAATAQAARILVVIPFSAKSHYIAQRDIGLELARRGHRVHVITSHREPAPVPPTYHQVMVQNKSYWEMFGGEHLDVFQMADYNFAQFQMLLYGIGIWCSELVFNSPEVKEFMAQDHQFDLVINEIFFQEALFMFAWKFDAPQVLITTFGNSFKNNYFTRNPPQLSTLVHEYGVVEEPGSFLGRLKNLYFCVFEALLYKFYYMPHQESLARKYFKGLPEPIPSLEEIWANTSLVLMNSHYSVDGPAANLPNVIEVGGLHLKASNRTLPQDLQEFLDSPPEGVVYMSLGSNVRSAQLPAEKRDAFVRVFGRMKQRVLWKWEEPELPDRPDNVAVRQWLPQKEILAHPNVRVFITHGGLIGIQEAVFNGIPFIGIPIFGDQYNNILQAKKQGYAEILDYHNINEQNLEKYLNALLTDGTYYASAKEASRLFKDRPMSPLDTAVYWIEYVIRNRGAEFMKNPGLELNLLAFYMVDVEIALLVLLILIVYGVRKLVKRFRGSPQLSRTNKDKKEH